MTADYTNFSEAALIIDGEKLYVNVKLLSSASDYFNKLFNSDFKEKSMNEVEIKEVGFDDFVMLMNQLKEQPDDLTTDNYETLLALADRFLLIPVKNRIETFIHKSREIEREQKLRLADKYNMELLLEYILETYQSRSEFENMYELTLDFCDHTRSKLFQKYFWLIRPRVYPSTGAAGCLGYWNRVTEW